MKIAFEVSSISTHKPTGIANYGRSVISALADLVSGFDKFDYLYKLSRYRKRHRIFTPCPRNAHFYIPQLSGILPKYDVIHSLDAYIAQWKNTRRLTTIHDLFVLLDGTEEYFPGKFILRKKEQYKKIERLADVIITVSNSTKTDILERLNMSPDRVFVTPLGISNQYRKSSQAHITNIRKKYNISGDYLFFVGNISSRKNVQRIVKAFHQGKFYKDFKLVLCGSESYRGGEVSQEISALKLHSSVLTLNYVIEEDIPALYSGAAGFVFPTLYEGFGMPALEAMACKTPVLASTTGAAPEVCGHHAVLVDPYSVEDISSGISNLLNTSQEKIEAAYAHATQYTWRRCAEKTLNVYKNVV